MPIENNQLRTGRILGIKTESPTVKTFTFKDRECSKAKPGQFLMLWIPGVDEIPLSILDSEKDGLVSVAVKRVGEATQALHNMRIGDVVGMRGPFGNSFTLKRGRLLMVAGGTGTAPLLFLANRLEPEVKEIVFVLGAKTKAELVFKGALEKMSENWRIRFITSTEDGSCGVTGLCTEPLEQLLHDEGFDMIYACGPEQMLVKVCKLAEKHDVDFEASLERLMRCAMGLCGSCIIGRYRVCRDGPVFNVKQLKKVETEFGIFKRDFDGKKIRI